MALVNVRTNYEPLAKTALEEVRKLKEQVNRPYRLAYSQTSNGIAKISYSAFKARNIKVVLNIPSGTTTSKMYGVVFQRYTKSGNTPGTKLKAVPIVPFLLESSAGRAIYPQAEMWCDRGLWNERSIYPNLEADDYAQEVKCYINQGITSGNGFENPDGWEFLTGYYFVEYTSSTHRPSIMSEKCALPSGIEVLSYVIDYDEED